MTKQKLGDFLINRGVLSREELADALKAQRLTKKKLGLVLVERGYLAEDQLTLLLGEYFGMRVLSPEEAQLSPGLVSLVPRPVAIKNKIIPVSLRGNELYVAGAEPVNGSVLENLARVTGRQVRAVLMGTTELDGLMRQAYNHGEAPADNLEPVAAEEPDQAVKILEKLIQRAILERASDLHLEPESEGMRVRLRVDGVLRTLERLSAGVVPLIISRLKVLGNMNIAERRSPQDGGFLFPHEDGHSTNIRISTLPCSRGEKAVLRLFSAYDKDLAITELGMEEDTRSSFQELLKLPHGLILVTGPTGSGKTFTLYSALKYLRSDRVNIITIEDPIELQMEGITQVQADESKRKLSFSNALRAVLRQDPNVIMVGEIRDGETARLALQAALTGHIVLSTLHTNDAVSAVDRLVDMGCEPYLVSSALRGVLAQRLVRVICPKCRREYRPTASELTVLGLEEESREDDKELFYAPGGCALCQGSGYRGRTGLFELLVINNELQKLISEGGDSTAIRGNIRGRMRTLREDGIVKLRRGKASVTDVNKATMDL
ncbi:MAG: GspE/PulE family protein [Firmicutes bacterium]|nr:GspE/PulE family protein [Bacillota bacterium]